MSSSRSIGNDIVDLTLNEPKLHPRYIQRVFTPEEQGRFGDDRSLLWLHWAAKEAAYKTLKRLQPELIFAPRSFQVDLDQQIVRYEKLALAIKGILTDDYALVVCVTELSILEAQGFQSWIQEINSRRNSDSSIAVREMATQNISALLHIPEAQIEIRSQPETPNFKGKIPQLYIHGVRTTHLLSFSHHGRFVVCSCCLDDALAAPKHKPYSSSQKS